MYNSNQVAPVSNYQQNQEMKVEDIIAAYINARRNKRKSPDQVEFEMHWERNCARLCDEINNRALKPTAYTFVVDYPKPREVFASDMATRVLHHYIDMRLRPFLEARMGDHTFNNRVNMGTSACQDAVISDIYEVSKGFTEDAWIIKLDMAGCFPNIRQDTAYRQLEEVVKTDYEGSDKDDLLYILQVCVYSYPTHHCYRKSRREKWDAIKPEKSLFTKPDGIGAAIGHLIWQNAVNYYFNGIDHWLTDAGIHYNRYVDDMYFVVGGAEKTAFLTYTIPEIRRRLAELGASLNEKKFYCQHASKGCECLGLHLKMDRIYPNERVIRRGIRRAREFNACIRAGKVDAMIASINSYMGICKNTNGYNQARRIIRELDDKWLKYVEFNTHRVCLTARPGYRTNERIVKRFNLK